MSNKKYYLGIDIGGTKCAVILSESDNLFIIDKLKFNTNVSRGWKIIVDEIIMSAKQLLKNNNILKNDVIACGVSCGGPLDSEKGIINCPPNLPDWDNVPLKEIIENKLNIKCKICNDADACALAEWKFGAGKGMNNLIFLTFGTGMGAGLILNGKLYSGSTGTAGEVGHIRLSEKGPFGYGKFGSFEGYCSGGGISNLAKSMFDNYSDKTALTYDDLSAKSIALAADNNDQFALAVYNKSGEMLGYGLSILIDILNPEVIIIGSIYQRSGHLLIEKMSEVIEKEALTINKSYCKIMPSALGDEIGDYASIGVAKQYSEELYE